MVLQLKKNTWQERNSSAIKYQIHPRHKRRNSTAQHDTIQPTVELIEMYSQYLCSTWPSVHLQQKVRLHVRAVELLGSHGPRKFLGKFSVQDVLIMPHREFREFLRRVFGIQQKIVSESRPDQQHGDRRRPTLPGKILIFATAATGRPKQNVGDKIRVQHQTRAIYLAKKNSPGRPKACGRDAPAWPTRPPRPRSTPGTASSYGSPGSSGSPPSPAALPAPPREWGGGEGEG